MQELDSFEEQLSEPKRKGLSGCAKAAIVGIGLGILGFAGLIVLLFIIGTKAPETSVYRGSQVPEKYLEVLRELGALEAQERLLYFYSDGLLGIEEAFYFVSDRKVCIYIEGELEAPFSIAFDEILEAQLKRETSFFVDSEITLHLQNGEECWFPVSSELDRDEAFHQAIVERMSAAESGH